MRFPLISSLSLLPSASKPNNVTNDLNQRAEELSLLGWTKEGAKQYAQLFEDSNLGINLYGTELLITICLTLLFFSIGFVLLRKTLLTRDKSSSSLDVVQAKSSGTDPDKELNLQEANQIQEIKVSELEKTSNTNTDNQIVKYTEKKLYKKNPNESFISSLFKIYKETSIDTNQLIGHIIFAFYISFESAKKGLDFLTSTTLSIKEKSNQELKKEQLKESLLSKDLIELKNILKTSNIMDNLKRKQLTNLILSNSKTIELMELQQREADLMKMKNSELRNILKNSGKLSGLRKKQLVDKILYLENGNKIN